MPAAKQTARILLIVTVLSLWAGAQQQNPCLASQPTPPPSPESPNSQQQLQNQNDMTSRSSQLDCVQQSLPAADAKQKALDDAIQAAHNAALRSKVQALKIYSDAVAQLAADFSEYVNQNNSAELPPEQIHQLQEIVAISHSIRETLAGHGLPIQHGKDGHDDSVANHSALAGNAEQCLSLATDLKKTMDAYLQQNNQNTVSAVELKDKTVSSSINKTAEELETLAFKLQQSAIASSNQAVEQDAGETSLKQSSSQESPSKDASLVLKANTRMVLVDAVVTDAQGKPVSGLKAEDFTIMEDGKKQVIKAFGVRSGAQADPNPSSPGRLPPGLFTNIPDLHAEDGPPTIILVDFLNTLASDQVFMREQLAKYITNLGKRRNICIYALGKQLRLLQDFTDNKQTLLAALGKTSPQTFPENEDPDFMVLLSKFKELQEELKDFDFAYRFFVTMDAFKGIAHNTAGYPGRKNLIWFSAAFPMDMNQLKQRDYYDAFHKTASLLTDAQISVYPVDPQGLVGDYFLPDVSAGPGGPIAGRQLTAQSTATGVNLQALHYAMNYVAGWTGGRSFYGRNDLDQALGSAMEDGSTYYALGYYPENKKWNGEFRKIEVKVAGNGLHVRHRDGYFATDTKHRTSVERHVAQVEFTAALRFESPVATMLPFVAQVIPPSKDEPAVTVEFGVDPHALVFDSRTDKLQHAHLDFAIVAFDSNGNQIKSQFNVVTTQLNAERYATIMNGRLGYRQKITLPPGKYLLKMGVRDITSDEIGTVAGEVEVPPPG